MEISFEKELDTSLCRMRSRDHWLHWIHPANGPLPELLGEFWAEDHQSQKFGAFIGAAWLTEKSVITAIEALPINEEGDVSLGSRILRTYCWKPKDSFLICDGCGVLVPTFEGEDDWDWKRDTMIEILKESVILSINRKTGSIMRGQDVPLPSRKKGTKVP